jgi:hypothetical protein
MADLWYYTSEGKQMEPVNTAEIKQLARKGLLKPTDMVWREGLPRWIRASAAKEIFPDPLSRLEQALAGPASPPVAKPAPAPAPVVEPEVVEEPVLLEPMKEPARAAKPGRPPEEDRPARPRDEAADPDIRRPMSRRGYRRDKTTGTMVLLGLVLGGGLLLVVLVLGLFFIAFAAR